MPPLTVEERRERARSVREAADRLQGIENLLLDFTARLPGMVREVQEIRETINAALAPPEEENDD
jgi:hypothetical protein